MRKVCLVAAILTCALSLAWSKGNSAYSLYYLDPSGKVMSVKLDSRGGPESKPVRVSAGSGFRGFSISPDGNYVLGIKKVGLKFDEFIVIKCYLEKAGKRIGVFGPFTVDSEPTGNWTAGNRFVEVGRPVYGRILDSTATSVHS
jgi:hypothetical protein